MEVKQERTGWRDLGLNDRHRKWGWNCPATDIDFIEYDHKKAVALIEYKNEYAQLCEPDNPNRMALVDVGNRARLPVFGVRYADDFSWWVITPLNTYARKFLEKQTEKIPENEFVKFLYKIRGR